MEATMNPGYRRAPRPPEPVNVDDPKWIARFVQWVADLVEHMDECIDSLKDQNKEHQAELSAWMTATKDSNSDFEKRLRNHLEEHEMIDAQGMAKRSVWQWQWRVLSKVGEVAGSATVLGIIALVLKKLGIL